MDRHKQGVVVSQEPYGDANTYTSAPNPHEASGMEMSSGQVEAAADVVNLSIVSNSRLLRDGLVALMSTHMELCLVGSYAGDLREVAGLEVANPSGHVVLLDAAIGQERAIAWTSYWRGLAGPPHVLVLELADRVEVILACIEVGASGYTLLGASVHDVVEAIRHARKGEAQCSPKVTAGLFARLASYNAGTQATSHPAQEGRAPLTEREMDVLRCIAEDYSNQEIAEKLVIQLHTVKHHVHNILEKLKLQHRWDAVRVAQEQGWLATERATTGGNK